MKKPGVYILISTKTKRYYTGSTDDIDRRLKEHNYGKVLSTKNGRPWSLATFIECYDLSSAKSSELRLKDYKRKDILDKVVADGIFPWLHKKRV
jgi:putative endonuclease